MRARRLHVDVTEILAVDQSGDAPPPFTVGDPLIRRPRHQGAVDLGWTRIGVFRRSRRSAPGARCSTSSRPSARSGACSSRAGFTVVDAGAIWRFTPRVEIFGRGLNLLDRQYEEAFGYPHRAAWAWSASVLISARNLSFAYRAAGAGRLRAGPWCATSRSTSARAHVIGVLGPERVRARRTLLKLLGRRAGARRRDR